MLKKEDELKAYLIKHNYLKAKPFCIHTGRIRNNQGAYLSRADKELIDILIDNPNDKKEIFSYLN